MGKCFWNRSPTVVFGDSQNLSLKTFSFVICRYFVNYFSKLLTLSHFLFNFLAYFFRKLFYWYFFNFLSKFLSISVANFSSISFWNFSLVLTMYYSIEIEITFCFTLEILLVRQKFYFLRQQFFFSDFIF